MRADGPVVERRRSARAQPPHRRPLVVSRGIGKQGPHAGIELLAHRGIAEFAESEREVCLLAVHDLKQSSNQPRVVILSGEQAEFATHTR